MVFGRKNDRYFLTYFFFFDHFSNDFSNGVISGFAGMSLISNNSGCILLPVPMTDIMGNIFFETSFNKNFFRFYGVNSVDDKIYFLIKNTIDVFFG